MNLKSLELQGFKSFADKTRIELSSGISAVVGPNGSGKSNIVEAIQWVLGEQSAKSLRGHKMQDVIFNGTKNRKPLGVAEISIVLDNSDHSLDLDFTDVKVTRRLYRSGEGEYLINGKNVRLKDIHRLFADSGIGSDGYAVIGQGRIAEILDSRPEDRRSIVEETAGIVKYRERKKEALRKMEHTDENLTRLTDIMMEIEDRLEPLEREAHNAEKFLEFSAEKDQLAIGMLGETFQDTLNRLHHAEEDAVKAQDEHEKMTAQLMAKEAKAAEQKAAVALENDAFHREEQRYHEMKLDIEKAEGELKSLDAILSGYDDKESLLRGSIQEEEGKEQAAGEELASATRESIVLKERLDGLRNELTAMEDRRKSETEDLLKAEREMEALRNEAFEKTRECGRKKNERIAAEHQKTAMIKRLEAIAEKNAHYEEEAGVLDRRMAEIQDRVDDLLGEKDQLSAEVETAQKEAESYIRRAGEKREALVELKMRLNRGEARLKVLEELTLKREGFYPGVRAVLERKAKGGYDGIYGVIAELIHVDKDYTVAIESVLGSALQNIVTETGEDAASAVAFLKEQRRGVATFLPLDLLRINERRRVPNDILKHQSYRGNAADMVTAPQRVKPAVEYLLGNTLIFENLKDAVSLTRRYKGQFRMVTVDGDVINAGGTVSGGSREKSKNSFLQRQNEVDELRRFLLDGQRKTKEMNEAIEEAGEYRLQAEKKAEDIRRRRDHLNQDIASFDQEINAIDTRREVFDREREALALEEQQLKADKEEMLHQLESIDGQIAAAEKEEERLLLEISRREEDFKTAKTSENEGRDAFTELQVAFAEAKAAYENNRVNLNRMETETAEVRESLHEKQADYEKTVSLITETKQRRKALESDVMEKNRRLLDFSVSMDDGRVARNALTEALEKTEQEVKSMNGEVSAQKEKIYQISLRKERLQMEADQCETQLREDYQMIPAEAIPYIDREKTKKEKKERIKTLKQQISALGDVHVGAIDEFKVVSERHAFLTAQRDDVLDARASLENIVSEMDTIIVKRFKETFDEINVSFQKTFPAFFHGGYGELQLTDGEHLLETGVDIVVQPPGKRLQHLSLLSGGEKSLSGIALLFAILKVKPSPFYVLDEIDAALDDANVRRFGDYLTKYGTDSQFLVITHRQGTMESAETMYGVTMAEEGVSKTVSVKLM